MTRAWAWGLNVVAVAGLIAVCARSIGAESHMAPTPQRDPACVEGPDYSAAVCDAASASVDGPVMTAGRDMAPSQSTTLIASADSTPIPAPARAPFSIASEPTAEPAAAPIPGERLASQAKALTEQATRSTTMAAMDFGRRVETLSRTQVVVHRHQVAETLAHKLGQTRDFADKARLYVFAGGGGGVVGYNLTREQGEVTASGWSMERTAQVGTSQLGMAWRKGGIGVALVGVQRKLAQFGASVRDNVVALKLSWSPGRAHNPPPSS